MPVNIAAQAGEGQLKTFKLHSNYNDPVDISAGTIQLNYYESVLDNTIRFSSTFADTGYRDSSDGVSIFERDDINMTSNEKVEIKIEDGYGTELKLNLQVNGAPSAVIEEVNKAIFSINMYSKECNDNKSTFVYNRYDGKIPDSVASILKTNLKTEKDIFADPAINDYSFLGHGEDPFHLCVSLAKKCVPNIPNAFGNLAGYLFFENYNGYQFRSIDVLLGGRPKKSFIFDQIIGKLPPGYDGRILDYSFLGTINLDNAISSGALTEILEKKYDRAKVKYEESSKSHDSSYQGSNNSGLEKPIIGDIQNKITRYTSGLMEDTGILPKNALTLAQQIPKSNQVNFNMTQILRQSIMRYNQLFLHKLSITIVGDFSLRAGDLILCDFPEVSGKSSRVISKKVSGIYMIADICHRLTKNTCYTRLNLVRDSIYRKG
jgi:hypothetical protein